MNLITGLTRIFSNPGVSQTPQIGSFTSGGAVSSPPSPAPQQDKVSLSPLGSLDSLFKGVLEGAQFDRTGPTATQQAAASSELPEHFPDINGPNAPQGVPAVPRGLAANSLNMAAAGSVQFA